MSCVCSSMNLLLSFRVLFYIVLWLSCLFLLCCCCCWWCRADLVVLWIVSEWMEMKKRSESFSLLFVSLFVCLVFVTSPPTQLNSQLDSTRLVPLQLQKCSQDSALFHSIPASRFQTPEKEQAEEEQEKEDEKCGVLCVAIYYFLHIHPLCTSML